MATLRQSGGISKTGPPSPSESMRPKRVSCRTFLVKALSSILERISGVIGSRTRLDGVGPLQLAANLLMNFSLNPFYSPGSDLEFSHHDIGQLCTPRNRRKLPHEVTIMATIESSERSEPL